MTPRQHHLRLPIWTLLAFMLIAAISCQRQEDEKPVVPIALTPQAVQALTPFSAEVKVDVALAGQTKITGKGICYGTSSNPTIKDSTTQEGSDPVPFVSKLTGLSEHTKYFVRAYAIIDGKAAYSEETTLTTLTPGFTLITFDVWDISSTTATTGGIMDGDSTGGNGNVIAKGICWSTHHTPTVSDHKTEDGSGVYSFTSYLTGLEPDNTYYYRAYAADTAVVYYGEEKSFTTNPPFVFTLTTMPATNVTGGSAICGYHLDIESGLYHYEVVGVCWATHAVPTVADNKDIGGFGGNFNGEVTLRPLQSNTTYYARAFITNSQGTTVYGTEVSFTTLDPFIVTVHTSTPHSGGSATAFCGGTVSTTGNGYIIEEGVYYSMSPNPDETSPRSYRYAPVDPMDPVFTQYLTYFNPANFVYHFRAYVKDDSGTIYYGEDKSVFVNQ